MIGQTISHYRILEKLGAGGMGIVYKAEDTRLKRFVALKFLPSNLADNPEANERLLHEAQAASALDHPHICNIHAIEESEGQLFLDLELVEGETLGAHLKRNELSLTKALDIAIQVAEGLSAAHRKGIIHRDLKPDNIMLTGDGPVKIMDFGLAKLKGSSTLTTSGSTLGTVAYMSPEQARGEEVDERTDIFSLGAVFYEMLTGHRAFKGDHQAAVMYALLNEEPEPLARHKAAAPPGIQQILEKALQKDKAERYLHIDDMAADMRELQQRVSTVTPAKSGKRPLPRWFVAAVAILVVVGAYLLWPKSSPAPSGGKSVAVLPFKNLSDSKEYEYFSDGITEDIIATLSKINDLKVISRTSVMQYKGVNKNVREIGRELDVATVLEGSVRRAGNQVRIVAQLIDADNEGHLWAETYDKEMTQVFAIQSDVARRIADALQAKLSPAEKTRLQRQQTGNTEAYQSYLKGRFYWNKRTLADQQRAITYFQGAIDLDPTYALAYSGLAATFVLLPQYVVPNSAEWYSKARSAAMEAIEIDSTIAEAHTVLAEIAQDRSYDWAGAERHHRRAIALDPGYPTAHQWYSCLLCYLGRYDEALIEAKRAVELDPLSLVIVMNLGDTYFAMRQYAKAREQYQSIVALDQSFPWSYSGLASVCEAEGNVEQAIALWRKAKDLGGGMYALPPLGWNLAKANKKAEALKILNELKMKARQGMSVLYGIGLLYYRLGDENRAFEWLEKSYEAREVWLVNLAVDPVWDDLRRDQRSIALLRRMGLPR